MIRTAAIAWSIVLVVGTLTGVPAIGTAGATAVPASAAVPQQATPDNGTATDDSAPDEVTPGHRLMGILGVQRAEVEGEIENRTFGLRVARAATADARAAVVAEQLDRNRERVQQLRERREALEAARANGTLPEGAYQARLAALAAQSRSTERLVNASAGEADRLPEDVLERNGVNVTAIRTLRDRAHELSGPEVAAIARTIAGPGAGRGLGAGPPEGVRRGPPAAAPGGPPAQAGPGRAGPSQGDDDGAGNASEAIDRAERELEAARERIDRAEDRVAGTNASDSALDALERARDQLDRAEAALADARAALESGDTDGAMDAAERAIDAARGAVESADEAIDAAATAESDDGSDSPGGDGSPAGSRGR